MATLGAALCEVTIDGAWMAVTLDEAHRSHRDAVKRCPACHGRVMILGSYGGAGVRRAMTHRRTHAGCPLRPDTYSGTPSPHPNALS